VVNMSDFWSEDWWSNVNFCIVLVVSFSSVKMFQQPAILPPIVNYLPPIGPWNWSYLILTNNKYIYSPYCLWFLLPCPILQNIVTRLFLKAKKLYFTLPLSILVEWVPAKMLGETLLTLLVVNTETRMNCWPCGLLRSSLTITLRLYVNIIWTLVHSNKCHQHLPHWRT